MVCIVARPFQANRGQDHCPLLKVAYRRVLKAALPDATRPRLRALVAQGRLAVIFSNEDLTAALAGYSLWNLRGYAPDSALALMRNAVLYGSGKKLSK